VFGSRPQEYKRITNEISTKAILSDPESFKSKFISVCGCLDEGFLAVKLVSVENDFQPAYPDNGRVVSGAGQRPGGDLHHSL
jgi:hypothetical protein